MKNVLCLIALLSGPAFFAQSASFSLSAKSYAWNSPSGLGSTVYSINFGKYAATDYTFSVYNPTTAANDTYVQTGNSMYYTRSQVVLENNYRGVKIDSFNPNGASDMKSAIATGLFNTIFKKPIRL
jgi:hypothetical protein